MKVLLQLSALTAIAVATETCKTVRSQDPKDDLPYTDEIYSDNLAAYPGYTGNVTVAGFVYGRALESDGIEYAFELYGLPPDSSGGIHVHTGTSCEVAANVGGHYFTPADSADMWIPIKWSSDAAGTAVMSWTEVLDGHTFASHEGHAIVVHDNGGARVACGTFFKDENACRYNSDCPGGSGRSFCKHTASSAEAVAAGEKPIPNVCTICYDDQHCAETDCDSCAKKMGCAWDLTANTCSDACASNAFEGCAVTSAQCVVKAVEYMTGNCDLRCGMAGWNQASQSRRLLEDEVENVDKDDDVSKRAFWGVGGWGSPWSPYGTGAFGPPRPGPARPLSQQCPSGPGSPECECSCNKDCVKNGNCCYDYETRCVF